MFSSTKNNRFNASSFQVIKDSMLQSDELPLSEFIDDQHWQTIFTQHGIDFGNDEDSVYTPAITLWGLISQVFFKEENRSCKAAVIRIASLWAGLGKKICHTNTGASCRARLKIPFEAVRDIARQLAISTEDAYQKQADDEQQDIVHEIVAACKSKGVNLVMKNHDKRDDDPLGAHRIDKHQRTTVWLRPQRPDWMSEQEDAVCPGQIEIRLVDLNIEQAGFRSQKYTIATTILDTKNDSRDWIASVYRSRWLVELDIRSIKCSLDMDIIRAKTPAMVKTEIWSCLLAYKLIRLGLETSCSETVGNRSDRIEPRANKRRPKLIALLSKPRNIAKLELMTAA